MSTERLPVIAVTMGDPCGIGPEVLAKALASGEPQRMCRPLVIGSAWAMEQALRLVKAPLKAVEVESPETMAGQPALVEVLDLHDLEPAAITVGKVSAQAGRASMEWVRKAAELCLAHRVAAMCTAPVNKEAAALGGVKEVGHTELLAKLCSVSSVVTMLVTGKLRCAHLTTHRSLRHACDYVKKDYILTRLEIIHRDFERWGMKDPRIGVAALNPHASDGGLIGDEEMTEIAPAVQAAREKGINATGPVPADIIFVQAIRGQYDVVLSMYHDQGHIPIKVYGFEKSISINLGLPIIRTSVDHGTAFDIAGKGIANAESMVEALRAAASLATSKGLP